MEKRGIQERKVTVFALLRGNSSEHFCHFVLTQQGVTGRRGPE